MPILHADDNIAYLDEHRCLAGSTPIVITHYVDEGLNKYFSGTGSNARIQIIQAHEILEMGEALQAFRATLTDDELSTSRMRVADEELSLGAARTLARLRASKGYSQEELAKLVDRTQSNMSLIERGIMEPGIKTIKRLATTLGLTTDDIITAIELARGVDA